MSGIMAAIMPFLLRIASLQQATSKYLGVEIGNSSTIARIRDWGVSNRINNQSAKKPLSIH